jgi:hypothetical protein
MMTFERVSAVPQLTRTEEFAFQILANVANGQIMAATKTKQLEIAEIAQQIWGAADIRPVVIDSDHLDFPDFSVLRNPSYRESQTLPMLLAKPKRPGIRAIATEPSGRFFCTAAPCDVAVDVSFTNLSCVRIRGKGLDARGRLTRPCEFSVELPNLGQPWQLLRGRLARTWAEQIVAT